ncbi:hypothetical protein ACVWW1_008613 [Bradyrhizobium sp. JR3.5]
MTNQSPSVHWTASAEALLPELIDLRWAIHAEPTVGARYVAYHGQGERLAGLPLEYREGPSTTRSVAVLRGPANADAQCCFEATWTPYRSTRTTSFRSGPGSPAQCTPVATTCMWPCSSAPPRRSARVARHPPARCFHVPARRVGLPRRAMHGRRWPTRSSVRRRFRLAHDGQRTHLAVHYLLVQYHAIGV